MSMLQLWEPFANDWWPDFFGTARSPRALTNTWRPAVDIEEGRNSVKITAELPGLQKKDIKISVDEDGVLTLSGERRFEKEEKGKDYHRVERGYGSFTRSFTLPSNVNADKIDAKMEEGLLTITLPKKEEAKAKEIEIH